MKIFTLIITATVGIMASTVAASASPRFKHAPKSAVTVQAADTKTKHFKRALRQADAEPSLWRHQHEEAYMWEEEWMPIGSYAITYTSSGLVAAEKSSEPDVDGYTLTAYLYNENDMKVSELTTTSEDGITETNSQKKEYAYDSRVTNFLTSVHEWMWQSDAWAQLGNNYHHTVTRNAVGNIVKVVRAILFDGVFDPSMEMNLEYGADGKINKISTKVLSYDYDAGSYVWLDGVSYTDIVWDCTDGQVVDCEFEDLTSGNNRIASAHYVNNESGAEYDADITITYSGQSYKIVLDGIVQGYENTTQTVEVAYTDANGSYTLTDIFETVEGEDVYSEKYTDVYEFDPFGYTTLEEFRYQADGMEETVEGRTEGTLTYDDTYGYPLTYTTSTQEYDEESDTESMVPNMRYEFSDYADLLSGIEGIATDTNADSQPEYYNLQGIKMAADALTPGLYIVRKGNISALQIMR